VGVIKLKRGNSDNFGAVTLEAGEPAFLLDTGKFYIGNGSQKVLINPDQPNAESASKLLTPRKISLSGDVTASGVDFDGTKDITLEASLPNVGSAGTYTKVTTDAKGRVTSGGSLAATDIPTLTLAKISDAGTAASKNVGTASGNVPVLDANGKLSPSILPALAISDTFVVANQAAMLALTAEVGDIAIRTDISKTFILKTEGASVLANWQELITPTDLVQSVNGKTGAVTISAADVGLGEVTNESKATMFSSPAFTGTPTAPTQPSSDNSTKIATTAFVKAQGYATLASPALTGIPTAPTAGVGTNTTQIATTAFVMGQGFLTANSVIDGGTF
jgi:hypothetical protein